MIRFLLLTSLAAALCAPGAFADGRKAGSVGIFPIHRSNSSSLTVVSITNTNVSPTDGETLVHFEYVNVFENDLTPFLPDGCQVFDRVELLTPTDTLSVLTACHNPGVQGGYLVVTAQDPEAFNKDWAFDYLIGSALVINSSGTAYSLNMVPFEANDAFAPGTQLHPAADPFEDIPLQFDGNIYEEVPDQLYIDSFLADQGSNLVLLNLSENNQTAVNTVRFSVWNDNEFPLSSTLQFKCWFDRPLYTVSPMFDSMFLAGNTPDDPDELDYSLDCSGSSTTETGWAIIDSIDVSEVGGIFIESDGAMLGAIATAPNSVVAGGRLLWESVATQDGTFSDI